MEYFMTINRGSLCGLFILILTSTSNSFASYQSFEQQVTPLYTQYMTNVIGTLQCKADDNNCYQKAFTQASNEVTLTAPGNLNQCTNICTTAVETVGMSAAVGFAMEHPDGTKSMEQLCTSQKYQQICNDAKASFCNLLCKKI